MVNNITWVKNSDSHYFKSFYMVVIMNINIKLSIFNRYELLILLFTVGDTSFWSVVWAASKRWFRIIGIFQSSFGASLWILINSTMGGIWANIVFAPDLGVFEKTNFEGIMDFQCLSKWIGFIFICNSIGNNRFLLTYFET